MYEASSFAFQRSSRVGIVRVMSKSTCKASPIGHYCRSHHSRSNSESRSTCERKQKEIEKGDIDRRNNKLSSSHKHTQTPLCDGKELVGQTAPIPQSVLLTAFKAIAQPSAHQPYAESL